MPSPQPFCSLSLTSMPRAPRSRSPKGHEWRWHWQTDDQGSWSKAWFIATREWLTRVNARDSAQQQHADKHISDRKRWRQAIQFISYQAETIPHTMNALVSQHNSSACLANIVGPHLIVIDSLDRRPHNRIAWSWQKRTATRTYSLHAPQTRGPVCVCVCTSLVHEIRGSQPFTYFEQQGARS